ncbi:MAG: hypothetical protein LC798_15350 [Chloroflexi bacterium]|nr:hypothetical protein [Chloroflexota bacterium]
MSILIRGMAEAVERRLTPEPERPPLLDPVQWTRERLNITPWSVQREVMRKLAETGPDAPRRLGVPACHGPGKTAMAAWVGAWWIDSAPPGERFLVTSAPTGDQVKGLLWKELSRAHRRASLAGAITGLKGGGAVQWHVGDELVGWGRKPQDLADPDQARQAFQGIHAPGGVLVLLDEATGIPPWLWEAALSLLTNASSRILAIGNPDDPSSTFAEKCAPGSGWWVRHISAFETPLFTGEPVSEVAAASLVSPEWVRDAEQDYGGKDNPLYQSKVLGRFPDRSDTLAISPHLVKAAQLRDLPGRARGAYGLDVARSPTGDWTALYRSRGGVIRLVDTWRGLPITADERTDSTVSRTKRHWDRTPAVPVVVDVDGLGAGAFDGLIAVGVRAVPFSSSGPARRPERFDSRRSELWWGAREALERGEWDLDPADDVLAAQLQTPRWWIDGRGRIHVETKKELAARGKKSPDRADAVIMADQGEPIDLMGTAPMGEVAPPRQPKPNPGGVPDALRVKRGEASRLKSRQM